MIKVKHALLFIFILSVGKVSAQESMMPSVNYAYLEKLIAIAKQNYPKMQRLQHKVEQDKYAISRAKISWFDALTFSYVYSPNTTAATANQPGYQPGVYFNVGTLLAKAPSVKMAREDLAMAEEDVKEYNLNIEAIVKERYFMYVQKQAIVNLRTLASNDAESSQKQIKYKFEKGEESFDNYSKALVMFSVSTQNKIEAEGAALIAKSYLEEIIGEKLEDVK